MPGLLSGTAVVYVTGDDALAPLVAAALSARGVPARAVDVKELASGEVKLADVEAVFLQNECAERDELKAKLEKRFHVAAHFSNGDLFFPGEAKKPPKASKQSKRRKRKE